MMARNTNVPFKGRIQKRKTNHLQIITFGLQRAAGPYRWVKSGKARSEHIPSGLPPGADIVDGFWHFRFVPLMDMLRWLLDHLVATA
jgi:hypothetical protein